MAIADALNEILEKMARAREAAPLAAPRLRLMGASKGQGEQAIEEAIAAGLTLFGENRVQEAQGKWPAIRARHPGLELHLIGPLQTNKVREALALFDVIQTLDREKLALALAKEMGMGRGDDVKMPGISRHPDIPTSPHRTFYIQINTGEEPQKAGIAPGEADGFIRFCRDELALPIGGLMCVPPADQPAAPHFALLRDIGQRNGLSELSMGMSGDFETAIRMGSGCVRIGTALFGARIAA